MALLDFLGRLVHRVLLEKACLDLLDHKDHMESLDHMVSNKNKPRKNRNVLIMVKKTRRN